MTSYIYIFCASETKEKNIGQYIRILEFLNHQISVSVWKKTNYTDQFHCLPVQDVTHPLPYDSWDVTHPLPYDSWDKFQLLCDAELDKLKMTAEWLIYTLFSY